MKKLTAIITVIVILFTLTGCFGSSSSNSELNVYFKNAQSNELSVEKIEYKGSKNTVDMANFAINKLSEGPLKKTNLRSIPENVTFSAVSVKNESATVDVSKEFTSFTGTDELLARFAVVRTLCDIPGITSVKITVEGENLISDTTGKEIGFLSKKDIVTDIGAGGENNVTDVTSTATITLYFSTSDAMALKQEERKIATQDTLSIEKTVINELLKGPVSQELVSVIPSGTKLISAETRDGVCYVNFSEEFVTKFTGGTGMLTVYSVVNSLCSIERISSVQILINGEKGAEFGNYVFDEPFEANLNLVSQK